MKPPVHAIEVAAAPFEALLLGERLPDAVFVPPCAVRPERDDAVPPLPRGERYRDVEIPIEAVPLVKAAEAIGADVEQAACPK